MQSSWIKKVTMELGSNSPLIIMPDADIDKVKRELSEKRSVAGFTAFLQKHLKLDTE